MLLFKHCKLKRQHRIEKITRKTTTPEILISLKVCDEGMFKLTYLLSIGSFWLQKQAILKASRSIRWRDRDQLHLQTQE
jgi:hypothetical protein